MQSEQNQSDTYMLLYSRNEASENNRSGPKGIMTTPTNAASGASGGNIGLMLILLKGGGHLKTD
jgi:hypothetical protein